MYEQIITTLVEVIITACVIFVTKCLIPWLKSKSYYGQITNALTIAQNFVMYAENLIQGENKGAERFDLVVNLLTPVMKKMNVDYTEDQIKSIVQSAYMISIGNSDIK